jgi:hypothetical protein
VTGPSALPQRRRPAHHQWHDIDQMERQPERPAVHPARVAREHTVFMQQSNAIDRPVEAAIDHFERHVIDALPRLVADAKWAGPSTPPGRDGASAAVTVGPPRRRADATLYAVGWPSSRADGRPEVDLDLEIAPLSRGTSRLQLAGQLQLPWIERWSAEEGSAERHCTIAMVALLDAIATSIVERSEAVRE